MFKAFLKCEHFFSLAIRISAFATDDISITRYNCRLTWTNLKILPKFGDQHSIYLGFLRWLNWSILKNLWKISIVIFSKPLRCVQRKPLTAEVLNFTKRPGEKVLTNYHRKSLFKDNVRWHQIHKDEYCLFYSSFSFYKNLGCCLYCCRWPSFPREENDSRSEENISKRMSVQ